MPEICPQNANGGAPEETNECPDADPADLPRPGFTESFALARDTVTEWMMAQNHPDTQESMWARVIEIIPRGVTIKLIFHDDIRDHDQCWTRAQRLSAMGAAVRTTSAWVPDLAISDRQTALVSGNPSLCNDQLLRTDEWKLVSILTAVFDQAWASATPLGSRHHASSSGASPELQETERQLLALLGTGATDETAARYLGISLRTARRRMEGLMRQLAATSRFQAGVEAAKRGWLA